jgi:hypothetical protein
MMIGVNSQLLVCEIMCAMRLGDIARLYAGCKIAGEQADFCDDGSCGKSKKVAH